MKYSDHTALIWRCGLRNAKELLYYDNKKSTICCRVARDLYARIGLTIILYDAKQINTVKLMPCSKTIALDFSVICMTCTDSADSSTLNPNKTCVDGTTRACQWVSPYCIYSCHLHSTPVPLFRAVYKHLVRFNQPGLHTSFAIRI